LASHRGTRKQCHRVFCARRRPFFRSSAFETTRGLGQV
jgi:hypothetical protein